MKADKADAKEVSKEAEYKETLQRLQAEFDNFRKRNEKEMAAFKEYASAEFVKKLLPVLDSFELALKNNTNPEQFRKGVEMIYAQLSTTLEDEGLRPIKAVGEVLDPFKHEVLLQETGPEGIIEELQRGYMFKAHVLRTSKVKVGTEHENRN